MKKACVIGYPISHSLSPVIHNYWLKKYGIEGEYSAIEVRPEDLEWFLNTKEKESPDDEDWIYTLRHHLGKLQ